MNTVIYHSADFDGIFCREIARKFLPDAKLIGWNHGDAKIPMPAEGMVYIVDLSPECLAETFGGETVPYWDRIIWIDHHKSSIEKWPETIPGYRIDGVAACRLVWQWFTVPPSSGVENGFGHELPDKNQFVDRKVSEPLAVRLAGEYDIWDKRDPDAELLQHGLRSMELQPYHWGQLLSDQIAESLRGTGMEATDSSLMVSALLEKGLAIQYVRAQEYAQVIKSQGFDAEFEGLKFLCCCSHECDIRSHLFAGATRLDHDALCGFTYTGKDWRVSLYHVAGKEHHDLSLIAKKFGGGGHRGACGFRTPKLPFKISSDEGFTTKPE